MWFAKDILGAFCGFTLGTFVIGAILFNVYL